MTRRCRAFAAAGLLASSWTLATSCSGRVSAPAEVPIPVDSFVLSNVTVIDGHGGAPVPSSSIVVTEGRIAWVGPASSVPAAPGAAVHDMDGKYVMPGIMSLHTHVAMTDGVTQDPKKFFTRENVMARLGLYAQYGVTTVLSMGTDQAPLVYEIREEQRTSRPQVARIFTAGRGFTNVKGYPSQVLPGGVPYEVATPAEAAANVKALASQKPDVVKIWVDDHFKTMTKIPIALSRPVIDEAHANGLRALAHVFYLDDARQLVEADLDGFVHSVRDRAVDDALIAAMKQRGTWLVAATLAREASMFAYAKPETFMADPFFTRGVPPNVQAIFQSPEFHTRVTSDPHFPAYPGILKTAQQNLKRLYDAGVKVGFGTDTGPPNRFAGFAEHWEMQLMVEAGLTPAQVIGAATKTAAEFLGAKDLGTIEAGKWADLLVLSANPLEDIRNTRRIDAVYVAGHKVP